MTITQTGGPRPVVRRPLRSDTPSHARLIRLTAVVTLLGLPGWSCRTAPSPPTLAAPDAVVIFTYSPPATAPPIATIAVRGSFNDWSEGALPMSRLPDGSWSATIRLEPGTWEYKFFINGQWPPDMCADRVWGDPHEGFRIDPGADECVDDGHDGRNAVRTVDEPAAGDGRGFSHDPRNVAHLSLAAGRLSVRFRANQGHVRAATVDAGGTTFAMSRQLEHGNREVWRAALPVGTKAYRLSIELADGGPWRLGPYAVPETLFRDVPWVASSIGYQIFPERFWNGDPTNDARSLATSAHLYTHADAWGHPAPPVLMRQWGGEVMDFHCCHQYWGGDLQGILDRLDHLQSLGVTLLYLNPLFIAGSAHGYDTFDHLRIAPGFGDERLLRRLLDEAHARGMRVMWDFVPNHVGVGHWAFQHAITNGEASPYRSWFRFRVPPGEVEVGNGEHYGAWWGHGSLPELETRNPAVLDHLLRVVRHWTSFGFDGIRVDVPGDLVNRKEFFPEFRRVAKEIDPDVYLVGEVWGRSAGWLQGDEFDALMNYAIGRDVIQRFASGSLAANAAAEAMARLYAEYPEASVAMQFNLISSHDTPRLLTSMGGGELGDTARPPALARQRLASVMLYSLPGMPVTFQGDECALLGGGPPREENRYPIQWQDCDVEMVAHYRRLARLRRDLAALRSPVIRDIRARGSLLAFVRGEPGEDEVLVLFNSDSAAQPLRLPAGRWIDALSGQAVVAGSVVTPLGWRHLKRAPGEHREDAPE